MRPEAFPAILGSTYDPALDGVRLNRQQQVVWDYVFPREWVTLHEISAATGEPEASVSARLRDYRRIPGVTVDRRRVAETRGLFEYRVTYTAPVRIEPKPARPRKRRALPTIQTALFGGAP